MTSAHSFKPHNNLGKNYCPHFTDQEGITAQRDSSLSKITKEALSLVSLALWSQTLYNYVLGHISLYDLPSNSGVLGVTINLGQGLSSTDAREV